ncbi:hypothetical protein [Arcicella lustrica]|uniref:Uncharacterized protein n=1 Tax=Arcicella lustrica TaxID=2984196 RepID=A0ABU5SJC3_9BACT|nr:hypothetical protein [Arcicella sp. DC25W]MEA5427408.1 hypothetical protein [Arcicella sp. DC25W]
MQNKYWYVVICVLIFLVFSFIYFPEIIRKRISNDWTSIDISVQQFVNNKIEKPLQPTLDFPPEDHFRKRDLRITPYLLANVFSLNSLRLFYLQILLLPVFIWFSIKIINRVSKNAAISFWGTIALLFSYVGNSFNYDTLFYDSYAYLGLVIALYFYKSSISIVFLLASYFVDERSIAPSLIIPLFAGLTTFSLAQTTQDFKTTFYKLFSHNKSFWTVFISVLIYIFIRILFYKNYHLDTPIGKDSGVSLGLGFIHRTKIPFAIFSSLKLNLLLILSTSFYLIKKKYYIVALWFIGIFVACFLVGTAVEDVTRSLSYTFLLVFVVYLLVGQTNEKVSRFIYFIALVNILTPTYSLLSSLYRIEAFSWFVHFSQKY